MPTTGRCIIVYRPSRWVLTSTHWLSTARLRETSMALRPQPHAGRHGDPDKLEGQSRIEAPARTEELLAWRPIAAGHKAPSGELLGIAWDCHRADSKGAQLANFTSNERAPSLTGFAESDSESASRSKSKVLKKQL